LQNVTIVVLFFSCALVLLGSLNSIQYVDATHGANFRTELIQPGSEILTFRDSTNDLLQTSTLSVDTSTVNEGFITIVLQEDDANLQSAPAFDTTGVEIRIASVKSSSDSQSVDVPLVETSANSRTFVGTHDVGPGGEVLTITYILEPQGVGRFTAEYGGVTGPTAVAIGENWKENINGDIFYECTDLANTAPFDLITYPIQINGGVNPGSSITVTMSYANGWEGWDTFYTRDQLIIVYRSSPCAAFQSLGGIVDDVTLTVTNELQPGALQQGQYAVAVDCECTPGGGGGGLVRPPVITNIPIGAIHQELTKP